MALLRVDNVGAAGFLPDVEYWQLEKNAWTYLQDVSLSENSLRPPYKTKQVFNDTALAFSDVFLSVFIHKVFNVTWYILCASDRVYVSRGRQLQDITPAGFTFSANEDERWQATVLNGYLILNNAQDEPHYWPLVQDGGLPELAPLSSYPGESPWTPGQSCRFILAFSNTLLAGHITNDTGIFPYLVIGGDFAEPGTLPQSWLPGPANSAVSRDLAEGQDQIVGALVFRDTLIVRKRKSVAAFRFQGGNFVYAKRDLSQEITILNKHCIVNTERFQLVVGDDDIFVTNGQSHESVVKSRTKEWFFSRLNRSYFERVFTVHNTRESEIWICAPLDGATYCNQALIWNYAENTFTVRTCTDYFAGTEGYGISPEGYLAWEDLPPRTWATWTDTWGLDQGLANQSRLFFVSGTPDGFGDWTRTVLLGEPPEPDEEVLEAVLERHHIPFPRGDVMDWESRKQISYVAPKCRKDTPMFYIDLWLGTQEDIDSPITWHGPKRWRPGKKGVFFDRSGRFISLKARLPVDASFRLTGYDIEYKLVSKR